MFKKNEISGSLLHSDEWHQERRGVMAHVLTPEKCEKCERCKLCQAK